MNSQYLRAKELGYSDAEIAEYFSKKDPLFKGKYEKARSLDYDPQEIFTKYQETSKLKQQQEKEQPEKEIGVGDYVSDFASQTAQGLGISAIGTYGDIMDLLGLQTSEISPGEKEKYNKEFDVLGKLQRGEETSLAERADIFDEDTLPYITRLPTSKDVEKLGTKAGIVTEPKTPAGRYGKRIGKLAGSSLSFGSNAIKAPIVAGMAGQTLEELGAPSWAQAAAEIVATLKYSPKKPVSVTSNVKEVDKVLDDLRKAGYSEKDITLAKAALEEKGFLKKYASLTPESENSIQQALKNSDQLFKEQVKKGLPGYAEGGLPYLEKQPSQELFVLFLILPFSQFQGV